MFPHTTLIRSRLLARPCFSLFVGTALWALTPDVQAQTPSFPGALGFGSYATGGRNGTVYHVTTLADSGPGSFRDAVSSGNRTIVFDVGGEIKLLTAVSCSSSLTIAGQTAPGGIVFNGGEISFANRNNIICRYLRIRPGSDTISSTDDALSFYRASNVIMDHSSIAFAPWNNIDGVGDSTHLVTAITLQNCIIANPTGQQFGCHSESVGGQWSWFYNIFANSHNRNPLAKVNDVFINNVEYNNSAGYTTHTSTKFKHDIVNNYFIAGPASGGNFPWYQIDKNQSIYYSGNLYDSDKNGALNGSITTPYWYQGVGTVLSSPWSAWTSIVPAISSDLAYRFDVSSAGAFPRDDVDSLLVSQIKTLGSGTTGTGTGTTGPDGGLYTSQTQTGLSNNGYGTIIGLTAPTDTDGDGMPDFWEQATGSNPNVANALTNTADGYTLLEHYLNYLAAPHGVTRTNIPVDINLRQFTAGFAASATYSFAKLTNCTVTLLNATNAHVVPSPDFTGLANFDCKVVEGTYSNTFTVTVAVTTLTPPDPAALGYGALIGQTGISVPVVPPANLTWRGDGTANVWNTTTSNWLNDATPAAFKNTDAVTFDDSGSNTPAINLSVTASPGSFTFDSTKDYLITGSGTLNGSMNLSKSGTGSLALFSPNGYSGGTTLNDGWLILSNSTSLGSGALVLNGGSVSLVATGGPAIYNNAISVAAPAIVQISGTGNNNQAFGGALSGSANLDFNIAGGGTFSVRSGMTMSGYSGTLRLTGSGFFRWQGGTGSSSTAFDLGTNSGVMFARDGAAITLGALTGGPNTFLKGAGSSAVATIYVIGGKNTSTTFAGQITNGTFAGSPVTTAIVKAGTGTFTLTGTSYHSGATSVTNGALVVNGTFTASPVTAGAAGTLAGTGTLGGLVTINSGGKFSPGNGGPGTLTLGGGLTLNGGTLNFDLANLTTVGGGVNDWIAMTGGTLALNGTTTVNPTLVSGLLANGNYTLISGGASTAGSSANLLWGGPGGSRQTIALNTSTPGTVLLNVSGTPAASLVWRGTNGVNWDTTTINWANGSTPDLFYNLDAVLFDDTGSNPSSVTLTTPLSPAAITVNSAQNYTFSGNPLIGGGALTKLGGSTLTIANSNSAYAGAINIAGGTLAAAAGSALGSGAMTINNGASFALPSSGPSVFFGGPVTIPANQTGTISSGALGNGLSGNILSGNNASVLNLVGGVSFSGIGSGQFDGFTGTINVQPGATLRFSPNSSGNTYGSLAPTFVINGTLQPRNAGNTVVLGALSGSGALAGPQSNGGSGDTLYVIGGDNSDANFSGVISSNSAVAGSDVIVTKVGIGTLTLNGDSTYAGGTTVNAGTLRVNNPTGTGTGTGDLEISAGATLTGTGLIGSATTVDDFAILAPGDPVGALTFTSSLTLSDNAVLQLALGTSSDSVVVGGDLILTGQLHITNAAGFGPGSYPLFSCAGALDLGNLTLAAAPLGYNYQFDTNTPGVVKLVVSSPTPPSFSNITLNGTTLVFSGSNGAPSGIYYVLAATNLMAPLTSWLPIATNQFDANGAFSFTNTIGIGTPQNFYRLQQ